MTLPFLTYKRTDTIQGDPGTQLEDYMSETITVPPETLRDSESPIIQPAAEAAATTLSSG